MTLYMCKREFLISHRALPTMSAKSPWNTHAVVGIFYPRPFFAAKLTIVSPLPPLYNVESIAEALSCLERHHFPLQCCLYHLHTTLFYGGGDFVVRLRHKSRELFPKTFGRHCSTKKGVPMKTFSTPQRKTRFYP